MPLFLLDFTYPTPAENLAADEALLDLNETLHAAGALRFWESSVPFVVVGYGNRVDTEVNLSECQRQRVPVLRRCTGGGTVVQGPGCLNYALILPIDSAPDLAGITGTNRFIMDRHRAAFATLLEQPVQVAGHTDLALHGLKFSGNAQRRKKTHLLFHGTFLLPGANLENISRLLLHPSREPEYRNHRPHQEFVRPIPIDRDRLRRGLIETWDARSGWTEDPSRDRALRERVISLVHDRYLSVSQ